MQLQISAHAVLGSAGWGRRYTLLCWHDWCTDRAESSAPCTRHVQRQLGHLDREAGSLGLVLPGSTVPVLMVEGVGLGGPCLRAFMAGGDTEGDLRAAARRSAAMAVPSAGEGASWEECHECWPWPGQRGARMRYLGLGQAAGQRTPLPGPASLVGQRPARGCSLLSLLAPGTSRTLAEGARRCSPGGRGACAAAQMQGKAPAARGPQPD